MSNFSRPLLALIVPLLFLAATACLGGGGVSQSDLDGLREDLGELREDLGRVGDDLEEVEEDLRDFRRNVAARQAAPVPAEVPTATATPRPRRPTSTATPTAAPVARPTATPRAAPPPAALPPAAPPPAAPPPAAPVATPVAATPAPQVVAKVTRLRDAIGDVEQETNRPWAGSRQAYIQYDPMLETLIGTDPETGQLIPRLAKSWTVSDDLKNWTFQLEEGVQFHKGYGEFTAKDVIYTFDQLRRPDSLSNTWQFWNADQEKPLDQIFTVHDDHSFTVHFENVTSPDILGFLYGRLAVDQAVFSKAQWDKGGLNLLDSEGLIGTGSYQFLERRPAQSIIFEKAPQPHWNGENPDFQEVEIFWVVEDATRYAALLTGEAHIVDLPLDLQKDAEAKRGMKLVRSRFTSNHLAVYFGGMFLDDHPKSVANFDETVPWVDPRVRQAMNMAINRAELLEELYKGIGGLMYVESYHPTLEGWDDSWVTRHDALYGYNPEKAKALLAEAGYGPNNPVRVTAVSYVSPNESELPQVMEAVTIYWENIGIQTKIEDVDGGEISNRRRGFKTAHQVWPNIVVAFPTIYWARINNFLPGAHASYRDNELKDIFLRWRASGDLAERERLGREFGEYKFSRFTEIPLFWFPTTVVVDPDVVADWIFPGNTVPRACCFANIKAAR